MANYKEMDVAMSLSREVIDLSKTLEANERIQGLMSDANEVIRLINGTIKYLRKNDD